MISPCITICCQQSQYNEQDAVFSLGNEQDIKYFLKDEYPKCAPSAQGGISFIVSGKFPHCLQVSGGAAQSNLKSFNYWNKYRMELFAHEHVVQYQLMQTR